jgi:hypothetical protein
MVLISHSRSLLVFAFTAKKSMSVDNQAANPDIKSYTPEIGENSPNLMTSMFPMSALLVLDLHNLWSVFLSDITSFLHRQCIIRKIRSSHYQTLSALQKGASWR